jgi:lipopolysaccharide export system permease protein
MTFLSILVFISVIYFTSRMANNTEIVAIISSGASFHRFARPYLLLRCLLLFYRWESIISASLGEYSRKTS